MKLIDMKLPKKTKKEIEEGMKPAPLEEERDRYPWGLRLNFDKKEVDKLKILQRIDAGAKVKIQAEAKVIEVRTTDSDKGRSRHNVEIQIQKIGITNKEFETKEAEAAFDEGAT